MGEVELRYLAVVLSIAILLGSHWLAPAPSQRIAATYDCQQRTFRVTGNEYVTNGGFESDLNGWAPAVRSPTISTSVVHAGAKSAEVVSVDGTATFASQALPSPPAYLFSHWIYVQAFGPGGYDTGGLLGNTSFSTGVNDFVSVIRWWAPANNLRWDAWVLRNNTGGVTQYLPTTIALGAWHLLEVVVDRPLGIQCLFVDGAFVATASVPSADTFDSKVVIFGDTSQAGDSGIANYDDISVRPLEIVFPDLAVTPGDLSVSPAPPVVSGHLAGVTAIVHNIGDAHARNFTFRIFADLNGNRAADGGEVLSGETIAILDSGSAASLAATWTPAMAGIFDVCAIADQEGGVQELNETNNVACLAVQVRQATPFCPLSQGYWKNHPNAWPVDTLLLGNTTYTKDQLLAILRTPPRGDASLILGHQLIAAKLNVFAGADAIPVGSALSDADRILAANGVRLPLGIGPSTPIGQRMVSLASLLDRFNNGQLTPGC